jgi:hypothetical protein
MDAELLIAELAQIKAMLNTLLDFQRVSLEHDTHTELTVKYQDHLNWYKVFYEDQMREENGLPPLPASVGAGEKPTLDDVLDAESLE